jgi:hypothetical protein
MAAGVTTGLSDLCRQKGKGGMNPFSSHVIKSLPVLALMAAGSLFLCGGPAAGQQAPPTVRLMAPAAATSSRTTAVSGEFTLVGGQTLVRHPRVRVTDSRGRVVELLPLHLTQKAPAGRGFRALNTGTYPPGVYTVRLECDYREPGGRAASVATPVTTLTVAKR